VNSYAVPNDDDATGFADRFTTIVSAAMSGNKRIKVHASAIDDGTSWGCQNYNCKPARAVIMVP
jgi:hypothetical protein